MKAILSVVAICIFSLPLSAQISFVNSSSPSVGSAPESLVAADVNGDGNMDLITANYGNGSGNTLSVLTNDGNGGFALASSPVVGTGTRWATAADVNGDGKTDLIAANYGSLGSGNTLSVLTNNGFGDFALASSPLLSSGPFQVLALEVNGDDKTDLISVNQNNSLTVLTNNGNSGFLVFGTYNNVGNLPISVAAFTNVDGRADLVTANYSANTLTVLTNKGSGSFAIASTLGVGGNPFYVTTADVNSDGKVDLISANYGGNTLTVWTNTGSGFAPAGSPTVGGHPFMVAVADVNGDGKVELISANYADSSLTVLTNNGNGGFGFAATLAVNSNPEAVVATDVNGDGKTDLISANGGNDTLTILLNTTDFQPASLPIITAQPIGQTNLVGVSQSLVVGATAQGPDAARVLSYQWRLAGTNLPAATNVFLVLTNLAQGQTGSYSVVISNYVGSVTSSLATVEARFILVKVNGQPAAGTMSAVASATNSVSGGYAGGFFFYTLDGTTPTTSSTLYNGPFVLTNSALVRVMSLSADFTQTAFAAPVAVQIIPVYNLQTAIIGSGTLNTNPPIGPYVSNSVVTLTATGALHWAFDHWTGDATGSLNPLSVTMNGPRNVQAVFVQSSYPLTLSTLGGGSVTADGQVISPATYFSTGNVVALSAIPSNGWSFLGWQGTVSSTNNPLNLVINQTNNIQAIFGTTVSTNALGGRIVLSQPNPIPYGTILTASAIADAGNYLVTWGGSVGGTNAPTRITVTNANPGISALFATLPAGKFSLSVVVVGGGFVTNNPFRSYYNSGDNLNLKAITNVGTLFLGWSQDAVGTNNPLTVVMTTNKIIQANFGVVPTVSISPLSLTVFAGSNAVLTASAFGIPPLAFQWQNSQGAIIGATNAVYTISNALPANAGNYFVIVTNSSGAATSAVATVTVIGVPVITNQPPALTIVTIGHSATFSVGAYGWPALAYQWRLNGTALMGAASPTQTVANAFPANAGAYTVVITNIYGSVTSSPAILTVLPLGINTPVKLPNGQFRFTFDTAAGLHYQVEYSTNLNNWYPFVTIDGNGAPLSLTDPNTAGSLHRFYRINLLPP